MNPLSIKMSHFIEKLFLLSPCFIHRSYNLISIYFFLTLISFYHLSIFIIWWGNKGCNSRERWKVTARNCMSRTFGPRKGRSERWRKDLKNKKRQLCNVVRHLDNWQKSWVLFLIFFYLFVLKLEICTSWTLFLFFSTFHGFYLIRSTEKTR